MNHPFVITCIVSRTYLAAYDKRRRNISIADSSLHRTACCTTMKQSLSTWLGCHSTALLNIHSCHQRHRIVGWLVRSASLHQPTSTAASLISNSTQKYVLFWRLRVRLLGKLLCQIMTFATALRLFLQHLCVSSVLLIASLRNTDWSWDGLSIKAHHNLSRKLDLPQQCSVAQTSLFALN